jgi:phage FluMu gp28-like protein
MEPFTDKKEKGTTIGQMCLDAFSEDWEELEIAHMATSDEFRIELFSFHRGIDNSF